MRWVRVVGDGIVAQPALAGLRRAGDVRRRPEFQHGRSHRVSWPIRLRDVIGNRARIRHAGQSHRSHGLALPFVVQVEESLILDDRAAERATELVVVERRPLLAYRG